jgi:hypothetical protein
MASAKPKHMLWVIPAALVEKENAICGNAHGCNTGNDEEVAWQRREEDRCCCTQHRQKTTTKP